MLHRLAALLLLSIVAGCASSETLPTHPRLSAEDTCNALADRAASIKTMSAEGVVTLTRPDGESVRFDSAIVMQPPDRVRLRAWKFGQAVFDLTLTPDGVWLVAPEDSNRAAEIRSAGASAGDLARTWADLNGRFFGSPLKADMPKETDAVFIFRRTNSDGSMLMCRVDRKTLTPRSYMLLDAAGKARFSLVLERYTLVDGIPIAQRLVAFSDSGRFQMDLREIELNGQLPAGAFTPPRRAEKLK